MNLNDSLRIKTDDYLTVKEMSLLINKPERHVRRLCELKKYPCEKAFKKEFKWIIPKC